MERLRMLWSSSDSDVMERSTTLELFGFEVHKEQQEWDVTSPVNEDQPPMRPILKNTNASKSAVRAVLKDAMFSTDRDARRSSKSGPDVVSHGKRLSLAFLGADNQPVSVDIESRKVRFGEVKVHEFIYEKESDANSLQKVSRLQERFKGQDLSVVFHMLREEFERGSQVVTVSAQGHGLVRQLLLKDGMIYLQRNVAGTWKNEVACSCLSIRKFHFGRESEIFKQSLSNWDDGSKPSSERCGWIELQCDMKSPKKIFLLIFQSEGQRNSFIVLLRVMRRICAGSDLAWLDWADAAGVDDVTLLSGSGSEGDDDNDDEDLGLGSPIRSEDPREVALLRFKVKLSRGKPVRKVTRQGKVVQRTLTLMEKCLRLYSPTTKRGQVFGLEDDFVAIHIGTDDEAFVALREAAGPAALEPEKSAVIALTDHTCAVIFKDNEERDEVVYNLRYLVSKLHMANAEAGASPLPSPKTLASLTNC